MRQKIEVFHKILKSGCRAEDAKLRTADRLANIVAVADIQLGAEMSSDRLSGQSQASPEAYQKAGPFGTDAKHVHHCYS